MSSQVQCTIKVGKARFHGQKVPTDQLKFCSKKTFFENAIADLKQLAKHDGTNLPPVMMGTCFAKVSLSLLHTCMAEAASDPNA